MSCSFVVDSEAGFDASDWARLRRLMGLPMLSSGLSGSRSSSSQDTLDLDFVGSVGDSPEIDVGVGGVRNSILLLPPFESVGSKGGVGPDSDSFASRLDSWFYALSDVDRASILRFVRYNSGVTTSREYMCLSLPNVGHARNCLMDFKRRRPSTRRPDLVRDVSVEDLLYEPRYSWSLPGVAPVRSRDEGLKPTCGKVKFVKRCSDPSCGSRRHVLSSSVSAKSKFSNSSPYVFHNCGGISCPICYRQAIDRKVFDKIAPRCNDLVSDLKDKGYGGLRYRHVVLSPPTDLDPALYSTKTGFDLLRQEAIHLFREVGCLGAVVFFHPYRHSYSFKRSFGKYKSNGGSGGAWDFWHQTHFSEVSGVRDSPHFHALALGFFRPDLLFEVDVSVLSPGRLDSELRSGTFVGPWLIDLFSSHGIDLSSDSMIYSDGLFDWLLFDGDSTYSLSLNDPGTVLYVRQKFYERTGGWVFKNIDSVSVSEDVDAVDSGDGSLEARVRYLLSHVGCPFDEGSQSYVSGYHTHSYIGALAGAKCDVVELTDADFSPGELSAMNCRYDHNLGLWVETCGFKSSDGSKCGSDLWRYSVDGIRDVGDLDSGVFDGQPDVCTFKMKRSIYYFDSVPRIIREGYLSYSEIQDYLSTTNRSG